MNKSSNKSTSLVKFIPSAVTLFALCVGLMAIKYSFEQNWYLASSLLLFAAVLDAIDGRLARFLNSTSDFGAELDSLADFVNFGVVPAFIIYNWINKFVDIKGFDLALVLIYTICMAIRLARFNITSKEQNRNPIIEKYFFQGIPSPVAAAMMMMPLVLTFEYGENYFFNDPRVIISYSCIIAICAASTLPTISIKHIPVRNEYKHLTLLILGLIIVGLITKPWITLSIICFTYIFSIFVTIAIYFKLNK
ncbi:phosphatidylcholine/phosphatidylserine synthase [Rickettsiales bacterium]|nr:phosphatidylcholine/phosphatidylserine synthase [Rickettsiales bacterium]